MATSTLTQLLNYGTVKLWRSSLCCITNHKHHDKIAAELLFMRSQHIYNMVMDTIQFTVDTCKTKRRTPPHSHSVQEPQPKRTRSLIFWIILVEKQTPFFITASPKNCTHSNIVKHAKVYEQSVQTAGRLARPS